MSGLPRGQRDKRRKSTMVATTHDCAACGAKVPHDHVVLSVAPPGSEWRTLRFHSLLCMNDFFVKEEENPNPATNTIFSEEPWIDHEMGSVAPTLVTTANSRGA